MIAKDRRTEMLNNLEWSLSAGAPAAQQYLRAYAHDLRELLAEAPQEKSKERVYGHNGTIHKTTGVDVEVDHQGNTVSVWFRCQPLPFRHTFVGDRRAEEMRQMYASGPLPELVAVTVKDK